MITLAIVLQVLLALVFLMAGGSKLAGLKQMVENFERWRYPQWFRSVTGTVEVLGAAGMVIGIWVDTIGAAAGFWLTATMLGAVYTHIIRVKDKGYPVPAVLLVMALAVAIIRVVEVTG